MYIYIYCSQKISPPRVHMSLVCFRPQGLNDNSGLGPLLADYLQDKSSARGRILVLIINQLGDHQMRVYFDSTETDPGMICEEQAGTDGVFNTIKDIHRKSVEDLGGNYRDGNEKTCAIPLARTNFFEVRS